MSPVTPNPAGAPREPILSVVVVQWGDREPLRQLLAAWPADLRWELIVVRNDEDRGHPAGGEGGNGEEVPRGDAAGAVRQVRPGVNLGFGGGVNAGAARARGELLLILNPDACPEPGALEALLEGFELHPGAAGLAPRLVGPDGSPQWRWQLRDLPSAGALLLHALFLPAGGRSSREPRAGAPVAQPAAAALALRREAFEAVGGFDERFHPAWFEDVDLARRLGEAGLIVRYHPAAVFRHRLGSSVASLGYGPFLWIYSRNLHRYLARHHGRAAAALVRLLLPAAALLRLAALPLRRPRRAASRGAAARGLLAAARGALTGWRQPRGWARRWQGPVADDRPGEGE